MSVVWKTEDSAEIIRNLCKTLQNTLHCSLSDTDSSLTAKHSSLCCRSLQTQNWYLHKRGLSDQDDSADLSDRQMVSENHAYTGYWDTDYSAIIISGIGSYEEFHMDSSRRGHTSGRKYVKQCDRDTAGNSVRIETCGGNMWYDSADLDLPPSVGSSPCLSLTL